MPKPTATLPVTQEAVQPIAGEAAVQPVAVGPGVEGSADVQPPAQPSLG